MRFPWREYIRLGMGVMGIPSEQFWKLTMREFYLIHEARYSHLEPKFTRDDLEDIKHWGSKK